MTARKTTAPEAPPRAWQRMLSGRRLDLLDPSPLDVEIEDIAHGLSRVARWNGQTTGPWAFSVAQHSMLVERIAGRFTGGFSRQWRLAALLHDGPEYVVGDLISPFKATVGGGYKPVEERLQAAIHLRFGLPAQLPDKIAKSIKRADHASAYLEATQLAGFEVAEARRLFSPPRALPTETIVPMAPDEAKAAFLQRFHQLID
jgi:5'-deoxynucleotidase YfbR-like HD superfamily hydrolase